MDTKNQSNRVTSVFGILVLLASGVPAAADLPYSQTVLIRKNGIIGLGYQCGWVPEVLKLKIQAEPPLFTWLEGDTACTDNTGDTLWRLVGKEAAGGNNRWGIHYWWGFGAFSRNFRDQSGTVENHAAIIEGKLFIEGGGGGGATPEFSLRISDIDADVDSLGRHQNDGEGHAVWPPTDVDHPLNELEDQSESGESGGMAMPITYPYNNLPKDNDTANFTGKAIRIRLNSKQWGVDFYPMFTPSTKVALYKNGTSGTQYRMSGKLLRPSGHSDNTYYIHTCNGFTSATISSRVQTWSTDAGTPEASYAYDSIRVYLLAEAYKVFVSTPETTDDFVPVEACYRVPITVTRHPSAAPVTLTLKDNNATNPVKFYDAPTGGTGMTTKPVPMLAEISSKTFWVSGQVAQTDIRTIELLLGEEKKGEVEVFVVSVTINLPKGSLDSSSNPDNCWQAYAPYRFDFQGVTSGSPGTYNLTLQGDTEKYPPMSKKWVLEGGPIGSLVWETTTMPDHFAPPKPSDGDVKLKVTYAGFVDTQIFVKRRVKIYQDHLARDRDNFGVGISCKDDWQFTKYVVTVTMENTWNCHGSTWHMYSGVGNGFSTTIPAWEQVAAETLPLTPAKLARIHAACQRGYLVAYYTNTGALAHSQTVLSGTVTYGANNVPVTDTHGGFPDVDESWEWAESEAGRWADNVNVGFQPVTVKVFKRP